MAEDVIIRFMAKMLCRLFIAACVAASSESLLPAASSPYVLTNAFPSLIFTNPVALASPPGENNRLFIVEQKGLIVVITDLAAPTRSIFMDISGTVSSGGEEGLLGLAFHPGYATNGLFYVTRPLRPAAGCTIFCRGIASQSRIRTSETPAQKSAALFSVI